MNLFSLDINVIPKVRLIGHVSYKEPWNHFSRTTNEYIFYFVKSGELYIQEDDIRFSLKKNDCLLLEPNKHHMGFKAASCHYFFIHFMHPEIRNIQVTEEELTQEVILGRKQFLTSDCFSDDEVSSSVCYLPKQYTLNNPGEIFELLNIANDDFYNRYEYYKNYSSWKLSEIILKMSREYISTCIIASQPRYSKIYAKVASIVNFIQSNYANKITSANIEERFELNYDYLNRIFKRITGKSIFYYINEIRISKAKELITTTPLKFSEIAYLVGIDDQYYFSKLFKKIAGITPTQYYNDKFNNM